MENVVVMAQRSFQIHCFTEVFRLWNVFLASQKNTHGNHLVVSKKSPTGPTERTPKPEYLVSLAPHLGVVGKVPFNFSWMVGTQRSLDIQNHPTYHMCLEVRRGTEGDVHKVWGE